MNNTSIYLLTIFFTIPLLGCIKTNNINLENDDKSYINNFELVQTNSSNNSQVKIKSPKAIIDPISNDIEIFDSSIVILDKKLNNDDIIINSGRSILDNSSNLIRVFDNVNISLLDSRNLFINTNSLDWYMNSSFMYMNSPLFINFINTQIISSSASYSIESKVLKLNKNNFYRSIYNSEGNKNYEINIISDTANWYKDDNSLEFFSIDKQVETTINFLSIK